VREEPTLDPASSPSDSAALRALLRLPGAVSTPAADAHDESGPASSAMLAALGGVEESPNTGKVDVVPDARDTHNLNVHFGALPRSAALAHANPGPASAAPLAAAPPSRPPRGALPPLALPPRASLPTVVPVPRAETEFPAQAVRTLDFAREDSLASSLLSLPTSCEGGDDLPAGPGDREETGYV
jgi:hypothetical protein